MAKNKCNLKLKGYVGGWDFDSNYVDYFLDKHKGEELTVLINSLGGSVTTAMSIAASFKQHGNVHVHYVGYNASAATIASMTAKRVTIDKDAMYLVHKCSKWVCQFASANSDQLSTMIEQLDKDKRDLEKIDLNIAGMYAGRCKKTKAELLELMKKGGWLTAQEALSWGFVDEVTDFEDEQSGKITEAVALQMQEEGIPLPPGIDGKQPGLMRRMWEAWVSMFENTKTNISEKMAKILPLVCAALAVDALTFEQGKTSLSEEQAEALEKVLAGKDTEIANLKAQLEAKTAEVENLKKAPGEATQAVVDGGANQAQDAWDEFARDAQHAMDMFNAIP